MLFTFFFSQSRSITMFRTDSCSYFLRLQFLAVILVILRATCKSVSWSSSPCHDRGKSSPSSPHAGRTCDQNGYPVPRGLAVSLCTGGYKYVGLALQVGGRATGWQPVAVKKLTEKKPKLWPRKSRTEWILPRQWKRNNELRLTDGELCTNG
jgi:hypothetical protein